tara:strand:- start:560 stop:1948 length:1389 start_codon:yes stop_codon:yes gene_type:complete
MNSIHFLDWAIITLYFLGLIYIGINLQKNKRHSESDFILSGRKLSLTGFIATLVTTWYGAILGIGENTFLYGIQTWFIFSLPYYIFAMIYALWIAPIINQYGFLSIPDHFRRYFGESVGVLSAIIITFLASPAPYILSMGILLEFLFGIDLGPALLISTIFSIAYIWNGGFTAVVRTDLLQFILMFLAFILLAGFSWQNVGDPVSQLKSLPKNFLDPLGGNTYQYIMVWFFIAAWTFIDPGFFQRCAAADSPKTAKKGILIAIGFWAVFDSLTILCGLYAIGYVQNDQALMVYPLLALDILPSGIFGLFIIGILATLMSTIDSLSLISAITVGRDILWRIKKPSKDSDPILFIKRGLIIISVISLTLAFLLPSVVQLFYALGSVLIPGLILPFLSTMNGKKILNDEYYGVRWIIIPVLVSMIWFSISKITGSILFGIEPFYPGMAISLIYFISLKIRGKDGY